jgi:hypothetical protein
MNNYVPEEFSGQMLWRKCVEWVPEASPPQGFGPNPEGQMASGTKKHSFDVS